jgi:aspartyl-tRNA(Asn)/glutamyl-tRNA(Gln) amidotransferase subunit B
MAIEYEIQRHVDALESGQALDVVETRGFDSDTRTTRLLRVKDTQAEYCYMPDGNLPTVELTTDDIQSIQASLRPLPDVGKQRFMDQYGLSVAQVNAILDMEGAQAYFVELVQRYNRPKSIYHWLFNHVMRHVNRRPGATLTSTMKQLDVADLVQLIQAVDEDTITSRPFYAA